MLTRLKSNTKINVMHTVLSLETGGLERMVTDSAMYIDKNKYHVDICCFDRLGDFAVELINKGINVTLIQRNQEHYDTFFPFALNKLLRGKSIDILHMHSGTFFLGTQAGILARTPAMIYTDHGRHLLDPKRLILMDRFSATFVNKIVAVSKELEDYLLNVVKLPLKKTTTIINGIDTVKYTPRNKPVSLLKEFGISQNTKIIGTVGRLAEVKDQISLIEAFSIVVRQFPNSILMLVGEGPMRSVLQQLVIDKRLNNNVIFAGNRVDIPDLLNLLDVFLLTSLSEGTSISLLEAMSSGIPPVVTAVGGNPSIVNNGINGLLVKPKDVVQLAESVANLLNNELNRTVISKNAVRTVNDKYSLDKMLQSYMGLYSEMINK